jgi:hypothetical protein
MLQKDWVALSRGKKRKHERTTMCVRSSTWLGAGHMKRLEKNDMDHHRELG